MKKKRKRYSEKVKRTVIKNGFFSTPYDQVTYIYRKEKEEYKEVTNVSYEIKVANKWMTIVRFDSTHGYLHRHRKVSLTEEQDIIDFTITEGNHHEWLTFAIADLRTNYFKYRREFLKQAM